MQRKTRTRMYLQICNELGVLQRGERATVQFADLFSRLPIGLVVVDLHGNVHYVNDKSIQLFAGLASQKSNKKPIQEIMTSTIIKSIKTEKPNVCITTTDDGHSVYLLEIPFEADHLTKLGLIIMLDAEQVEYLISHSKTYLDLSQDLDTIMNLVGDLVTITDGNGIVLRVNAACEKVMGVKESDFVGRPATILEEQGIIDHSSTVNVLRSGVRGIMTQTTRSGRRLLVSSFPLYNDLGDLVKVVNISRDITEREELLDQIEELRNTIRHYQMEIDRLNWANADTPIMKSQIMQDIMDLIFRIADVDSTVLILGETGVGKEVIARTIHNLSSRKDKPFIAINCGSIPESLIESELFGYERGAFTGGNREGKLGLIAAANNGTLFLDEIGELPLHMQAKLLRVLQEKQLRPIGAVKEIKINVRFIAATNRNLEEMVKQGLFREDLFYRLNVISIVVPSLKERPEDIPYLMEYFLSLYNQKYGRKVQFHPDVMPYFLTYPWPGNIRELQNIVERLVVTCSEPLIRPERLPDKLRHYDGPEEGAANKSLKELVEEFERNIIHNAMQRYKTMKEVSEHLKVDVSTISRKARKYGIRHGSSNL